MSQLVDIKVPDIGDFKDVPVIEVFVKPGDSIGVDDAICTLESDKATMDVPASAAGVVKEVLIKVGDRVGEGAVVVRLESAAAISVESPAVSQLAPVVATVAPAATPEPTPAPAASAPAAAASAPPPVYQQALGALVHASPSVRAFARELGVDLSFAKPSGPKGRVTREDVVALVKGAMSTGVVPGKAAPASASTGGAGLDLLPWPKVDFTKFGEVEVKPLSRIKKISGANLARNWVMIPAVTFHEDADITDLEAFRVQLNKENEKSGKKLTMLAFMIKAAAKALQTFPEFNTSLEGDNLVYKKYYNIAFAADTPNGLVVPVINKPTKKAFLRLQQKPLNWLKKPGMANLARQR